MFRKMIATLILLPFTAMAMAQMPSIIFPPQLNQELYFAHFGNGEGLISEIVLVSSDHQAATQAQISLVDELGNPMALQLNGQMALDGLADVRVPAAGMRRLRTSGAGPLSRGSVRILSDRPLMGTVLFGGDFGLAGVSHSEPLEIGFRAPVNQHAASQIRTGIAVASLEETPMDLELRLYDSEGFHIDSAQQALAASGQLSLFVDELQWEAATDLTRFEGTLEAIASGRIAATALQVRPGQFASLPVAPLSEDPRQFAGQAICTGGWSGTYDDAHSSVITLQVVDQRRIESVRVNYRTCSGQPAQAAAASGAIESDRSFSIPLSGPDLVGNVAGVFSQDGQTVSMKPNAGVFILLQCGGGSFSWRAQPNAPCG